MKKRTRKKLTLKRETLTEEQRLEQAAGGTASYWAVWTYCAAGCCANESDCSNCILCNTVACQ